MLHVVATSPGALDAVDTETQDAIFEVEDIAHDAPGGVLTVPLRRWSYEEARLIGEDPPAEGWRRLVAGPPSKRWEAPWYRWLLRIGNADSFTVSDSTDAGGSSIERVSYDPARSAVVVQGSIPVTVEALVRAVHVELEQTDQALGFARYQTTGSSYGYTHEIFPTPATADPGDLFVPRVAGT